jgi:hypothetical protein
MKTTTKVLFATLLSLLAFSCHKRGKTSHDSRSENKEKGNDDQEQTTDDEKSKEKKGYLLDKLKLENASGLAVVEKSGGSSLALDGEESTGQLVSVDAAGKSTPVALATNGLFSNIRALIPVGKYVYIVLNYYNVNITTQGGESCPMVVLRLTDKRLFCIPGVDLLGSYSDESLHDSIKRNGSGDLHFFAGNPRDASTFSGYPYLYSVDFRDSDSPKIKLIFDKSGYSSEHAINHRGDLMLRYYEEIGDRKMRIIQPDGGFQPAGWRPYVECTTPGSGDFKDDFFYFEAVAGNFNRLGRLAMDNTGIFQETILHEDQHPNNTPNDTNTASLRCAAASADEGRVLMIGRGTHDVEDKAYLVALNLPGFSINRYQIPEMQEPEQLYVKKNRIIIVGKATNGDKLVVAVAKSNNQFTILYRSKSPILSADVKEDSIAVTESQSKDAQSEISIISDSQQKVPLEGARSYVKLDAE